MEILSRGIGDCPKPGRSIAMTRWDSMNCGICSSQFCHEPESPCTKTSGGPEPTSRTFAGRPSTSTQERWSLQVISVHAFFITWLLPREDRHRHRLHPASLL